MALIATVCLSLLMSQTDAVPVEVSVFQPELWNREKNFFLLPINRPYNKHHKQL